MNGQPAAIVLQSVSKRYGSTTVLHDLSFTVSDGEILGFLGPNGAGKTTSMRMMAGFTAATSGRVLVAGHDMATDSAAAAPHIGYLPERPPLYETLDVAAYLRFVATVKGVSRAALPAELDRVTAACRLEAVFRREIYKLSKGYRQRVGLAQALLGQPRVLLLDEPTAGLDPGQIHETREVMRAFGEHHAVVLSTHILAEATLICRRVAIINHGRLVAVDSPAGLQRAMEQTNVVTCSRSRRRQPTCGRRSSPSMACTTWPCVPWPRVTTASSWSARSTTRTALRRPSRARWRVPSASSASNGGNRRSRTCFSGT